MGARSSQPKSPNLNRTDGHLLEYFRNTFVEGGGGTNTSAPFGHSATGGVISDYTDPGPGTIYRSHVFTNSGTFSVSELGSIQSDVEVILIAGGGGGGVDAGGGGGAASRAVAPYAGAGAGSFAPNPGVAGESAKANSGSGGGGSGSNVATVFAGRGGSGLVLIAYPYD